jgi:O-antigen/teichoic acid export membrane protein
MNNIWRNMAWLIAERGLQILGALVITALMARALGAADFGLFQYAQSLVFVASAMAMVCGAEVLVPRLTTAIAAGQQAHTARLMQQGLLLRLVGAAWGYTGLLVWCWLRPETPAVWFLCAVLGLSLWLREPSGVVIAWSQAQTHNRPVVLIQSLALGLKLLLVALAYGFGGSSPLLLAVVLATESAMVAWLLWRLYARSAPAQTPPRAPTEANTLAPIGLPALARQGLVYFVGLLGMMLMRRLDQIMLKDQIDLSTLGTYAAAMQITDHVILLASIVAAAAAPRLAYAVHDNRSARRNILALSLGLMLAGTAMATLLTVMAPLIVRLIYGQSFAPTVTLLQWSAWLAPLAFAEAGLNLGLLRQQRARQVAAKWLCAAAVTGAVNALAIPVWGAPGALVGLACGFGVALVFSGWGLKMRPAPQPAQAP